MGFQISGLAVYLVFYQALRLRLGWSGVVGV